LKYLSPIASFKHTHLFSDHSFSPLFPINLSALRKMSLHESVLPAHSPPGNLPDMSPEVRAMWSKDYISHWMNGEIDADQTVVIPGRTKLKQFFNGTVTPFDQSQTPVDVTWNGFPNLVCVPYRKNRTLS
jgi:hypothetical protein